MGEAEGDLVDAVLGKGLVAGPLQAIQHRHLLPPHPPGCSAPLTPPNPRLAAENRPRGDRSDPTSALEGPEGSLKNPRHRSPPTEPQVPVPERFHLKR